MNNQALHLKFDISQAIHAKKNLLSSELNFLNSLKKIEDYLNLRKKELKTKYELKEKIKGLSKELSILISELPKVAEEETKLDKEFKEISKNKLKENKGKRKIEFELREIKRKLKELEEI